jgi:hypothetical protein
MRFELTGGNGRGADLTAIGAAIRAAGGRNVRSRRAFGMPNQPAVVTFECADEWAACAICRQASDLIWPGDESIMANLIAYRYK